ncbi:LacI family DNA-binding transcriptional regulator [Aeromonas dhakensis]|uniref:LacI family DNA-binding transcriptional regulator n=1 Tax=Aeromonas dhakensis TaxID=196024 RepID=UPI003F742477
MATIKQVAALANVSTATVSRVINNSAYVEPATRERVDKAMRTLDYRRDMAAVALAKRSGNMLGLLTGNLADPFFARLARGVEAISRHHGFRLMVCSGSHQHEQERYGLEFLINQGCEAIVPIPPASPTKCFCAMRPTCRHSFLSIAICPSWLTAASGWTTGRVPEPPSIIWWHKAIAISAS